MNIIKRIKSWSIPELIVVAVMTLFLIYPLYYNIILPIIMFFANIIVSGSEEDENESGTLC